MIPAPTAKGTWAFGAHRTWCRVTGDISSGRPSLVVVHGGPGSTHDYLLRLAVLAGAGWPVVHYDQLGNGGSTHLPGRSAEFWTVRLFLDELANLLQRLGVSDNYVLFGHSWGGALAAAHAATRPAGLRGLVVANSPASYPRWSAELKLLRGRLPPAVAETLTRHEMAGTVDSEEYLAAAKVFYDRHVCRLQPWPPELIASLMEIRNDPTVYQVMNGPTEFHIVGSLRDWSVEDRLAGIVVPTLVLSGEHDEVTPSAVRPFHELIPDSRWEVIDGASHLPHVERPERFDEILLEFLAGLL